MARVTVHPFGQWDDVPKGSLVGLPQEELPAGTVMAVYAGRIGSEPRKTQRVEHTGTGWLIDGEPSAWPVVLALLLSPAAGDDQVLFKMETPLRRCGADDCAELFIPARRDALFHSDTCRVRQGRHEGKY